MSGILDLPDHFPFINSLENATQVLLPHIIIVLIDDLSTGSPSLLAPMSSRMFLPAQEHPPPLLPKLDVPNFGMPPCRQPPSLQEPWFPLAENGI